MHILFCGSGWFSILDFIRARLAPHVPDLALAVWNRDEPLARAVRDVDVILPSNAHIDAEVIAAAPSLVLIQQPAAGVDNVDLDAARARGVPVCNAPGANPVSVAEAALLLMLALARRIHESFLAFSRRQMGEPAGVELAGKTLGVVGLGRSGTALAERARALGMRVHGVASGSDRAAWDTLYAESDVISLHCPLTVHTRGLIGADALARMKPGVLVVNCARGPIVDRPALEAALAAGRVGGFATDTPWVEPWDPADPLYARPDVIALPHIAGSTQESFARIADIVADNTLRVRRGEPPRFRVA